MRPTNRPTNIPADLAAEKAALFAEMTQTAAEVADWNARVDDFCHRWTEAGLPIGFALVHRTIQDGWVCDSAPICRVEQEAAPESEESEEEAATTADADSTVVLTYTVDYRLSDQVGSDALIPILPEHDEILTSANQHFAWQSECALSLADLCHEAAATLLDRVPSATIRACEVHGRGVMMMEPGSGSLAPLEDWHEDWERLDESDEARKYASFSEAVRSGCLCEVIPDGEGGWREVR